ncbi:MAG: hypothetical protein K2X27_06550 [Candidatus Obscuribacterales bacterium]|nr:hypothetical protein [Candidatus Obscuribacterales bacterium]
MDEVDNRKHKHESGDIAPDSKISDSQQAAAEKLFAASLPESGSRKRTEDSLSRVEKPLELNTVISTSKSDSALQPLNKIEERSSLQELSKSSENRALKMNMAMSSGAQIGSSDLQGLQEISRKGINAELPGADSGSSLKKTEINNRVENSYKIESIKEISRIESSGNSNERTSLLEALKSNNLGPVGACSIAEAKQQISKEIYSNNEASYIEKIKLEQSAAERSSIKQLIAESASDASAKKIGDAFHNDFKDTVRNDEYGGKSGAAGISKNLADISSSKFDSSGKAQSDASNGRSAGDTVRNGSDFGGKISTDFLKGMGSEKGETKSERLESGRTEKSSERAGESARESGRSSENSRPESSRVSERNDFRNAEKPSEYTRPAEKEASSDRLRSNTIEIPARQQELQKSEVNSEANSKVKSDLLLSRNSNQESESEKKKKIEEPINYFQGGAPANMEKSAAAQTKVELPNQSLARSSSMQEDAGNLSAKTISLSSLKGDSLTATQNSEKAANSPQNNIERSSAINGIIPTEKNTSADRTAAVLNLAERGAAITGERAGQNTLSAQDKTASSQESVGKINGKQEEILAPGGKRETGSLLPGSIEKGIQSTDLQSNKNSSSIEGKLNTENGRSNSESIRAAADTNPAPKGENSLNGKVLGEKAEAQIEPGKIPQSVKNVQSDAITAATKVESIGVQDEGDGEAAELDEDGLPVLKIRDRSEKRYLTGVELTIAAVIALSGAAKVRDEQNDTAAVPADLDLNDPAQQNILHRRTHLVCPGDTLHSIAESLYQNQAVAWLIADMNAANIKEAWIDGKRVVELKSRQQLELPQAEEVSAFMSKLKKDFEIDKLVSIVTESTVDRELLNNFLGSVSGAQSPEDGKPEKSAAPVSRASAANQSKLPEITIDMGAAEDLDLTAGIKSLVKDFSSRMSKAVKRQSGKPAVSA